MALLAALGAAHGAALSLATPDVLQPWVRHGY